MYWSTLRCAGHNDIEAFCCCVILIIRLCTTSYDNDVYGYVLLVMTMMYLLCTTSYDNDVSAMYY